MDSVGHYELGPRIQRSGMAHVHLGRRSGPAGFSLTVLIKSLDPSVANDPRFVRTLVEEAQIESRIRHANILGVIDVVTSEGALYIVLEYVPGAELSDLLAASRGTRVPLHVARGIAHGMLEGLHAAHEARSEQGAPLAIVHRDVSPHNVYVGLDGVPRLHNFGGHIKRDHDYMTPEQLEGLPLDRRTDLFSTCAVLWEILVGRSLFHRDREMSTDQAITWDDIPAPSQFRDDVPPELDAVIAHGLSRDPSERPATALHLARELEASGAIAPPHEISAWVASLDAAVPTLGGATLDATTHELPLGVIHTAPGWSGPKAKQPAVHAPRADEPPVAEATHAASELQRAPNSRLRRPILAAACLAIAGGAIAVATVLRSSTQTSQPATSAPIVSPIETQAPVTNDVPATAVTGTQAPAAPPMRIPTAKRQDRDGERPRAPRSQSSTRPDSTPDAGAPKPSDDCYRTNPDGTYGNRDCLLLQ